MFAEDLLQIQHCSRHIGCIAGFGKLRCSEKDRITPQKEVAAFNVVRTTYAECCASRSGKDESHG